MSARRLTLTQPPFANRSGRGVRVAVVDSGIAPGHPHVGELLGGLHVLADGTAEDFADRLGHGTAVAAAIREKAPGAELIAVKVFDRTLATSAEVLSRGIIGAAALGARLINLSLGTPNAVHAARLRDAVRDAATHGAIVVSAHEAGTTRWLPGCLPGVAGVLLDWECARDELVVEEGMGTDMRLRASGYPRPIPGVPPERNLSGISFAVANATGFLARLLEAAPDARSLADVARVLRGLDETRGREQR